MLILGFAGSDATVGVVTAKGRGGGVGDGGGGGGEIPWGVPCSNSDSILVVGQRRQPHEMAAAAAAAFAASSVGSLVAAGEVARAHVAQLRREEEAVSSGCCERAGFGKKLCSGENTNTGTCAHRQ